MFGSRKNFTKIIYTLCTFFIVWFLVYFLAGTYFPFRFIDEDFRNIFFKTLVFLASVSIYLFIIWQIKLSEGWRFKNIFKFILALIAAIIPFFIYGLLAIQPCPFWLEQEKISKRLYHSTINDSEIVEIKRFCPEAKLNVVDTVIYTSYFSVLDSSTSVDVKKINPTHWQKK